MYFDLVEVHEFVTDEVMDCYARRILLSSTELYERVKQRWPCVNKKAFLKIYKKCVFKAIAGRRA